MSFAIRYEHDDHVCGMAHVIYRDGVYDGCAGSEASARQAVALMEEFGYFDPTEPRQRRRMREMEGA
ncbi:MAG TPA: hypothetical protein VNA32_03740 [Actinomycetota bacterium]|nr:hypothetical protein [Actinomycetota bacterium]